MGIAELLLWGQRLVLGADSQDGVDAAAAPVAAELVVALVSSDGRSVWLTSIGREALQNFQERNEPDSSAADDSEA